MPAQPSTQIQRIAFSPSFVAAYFVGRTFVSEFFGDALCLREEVEIIGAAGL